MGPRVRIVHLGKNSIGRRIGTRATLVPRKLKTRISDLELAGRRSRFWIFNSRFELLDSSFGDLIRAASQQPGFQVFSREVRRFAFNFGRRSRGERMNDFETAEGRPVRKDIACQWISKSSGDGLIVVLVRRGLRFVFLNALPSNQHYN